MRVTFVQYAGDYREALARLSGGGPETYQAQRYSVNFVGSLAHDVAVICAVCDERYDAVLPNGVRAIGAGLAPGFDARALLPLLADTQPERLILTSPMIPVLQWAHRNKVRTITAMADSFQNRTLKQKLRNRWLAHHLNRIEWVGNHQLPASRALASIGVDPAKIIPWDWPQQRSDYPPRTLSEGKFELAYVGSISEAKGVGDLIRAVSGLDVNVTLYGPIVDPMPEAPNVCMAGVIPNAEVPAAMRKADAVVIPSRHEYPEGLPLTIFEALVARTPIIASDHPMFLGALSHGRSALIFPAGNAAALKETIQLLASTPSIYAHLSSSSGAAWDALQIPVTWGEYISRWLADDKDWLLGQSLPAIEGGLESDFGPKLS
jgi:glycosyltransferase involved in cell wall biosynthesis